MFEWWYASRETSESAALLDRAREAGRAEARAAAERLVAAGELLVLRCRESGERADWAADAWEAVAAQLGAALGCSVAMGHSYLRYAMAMRDRLPQVGEAFRAGHIDYRAFQTIVFRTDLITDAEVLARVDARVAVLLSRRPSLTRGGWPPRWTGWSRWSTAMRCAGPRTHSVIGMWMCWPTGRGWRM